MAKTRTEAFLEKTGIEQAAGAFLIGFSGGLDSTVLLHLLSTRSRSATQALRSLHVHHGLHPDADAWARHCQAFCAALGIELVLASVEVARDGGRGLEAAAREARYACFAQYLRPGETLALAHHQDDQAETVLLRLLRASGSQGLSAMRERRPFANGLLWRPLLAIPRSALLEYAQAHRLSWIEDSSNADQSLDRNFLRHRITPALAERWPHAAAALARSAELLAEDAELLRDEGSKRLAKVRESDPSILSTAALLTEEKPWRTRMLRLWLEELGLPPLPSGALKIIETEVLRARPDSEPEYRWAGATLRCWRGLLRASMAKSELPTDWCCEWNTEQALALPTGDRLHWIRAEAADDPIETLRASQGFDPLSAPGQDAFRQNSPIIFIVRVRRGGERIALPGREHSHALKHVLQNLRIPPWERERMPLVFAEDGQLLAAGDQVISASLQRLSQRQGMRLAWERVGCERAAPPACR